MSRPYLALEVVEVVTDGQGESQQFFERLLWLLKGDGDAARLERDPCGEILEFLRQNLNRGFNQKLGPFQPFLLQLRQNHGHVMPALPFVVAIVALGEAAQVGDERITIGQAVGTDVLGDAGSHDLLGAAAADAEQKFDCGAIGERVGEDLQFTDDFVDFAVPGWFCGHVI